VGTGHWNAYGIRVCAFSILYELVRVWLCFCGSGDQSVIMFLDQLQVSDLGGYLAIDQFSQHC